MVRDKRAPLAWVHVREKVWASRSTRSHYPGSSPRRVPTVGGHSSGTTLAREEHKRAARSAALRVAALC